MFLFTADQVRQAEQVLLDAEAYDDALMQQAAHAVAAAAEVMLKAPASEPERTRVLLLVGSGGNGGDALYAGAELCDSGFAVDAVLLSGQVHEPAVDAFIEAGGRILTADIEELLFRISWYYRLVIDGIVGLGGSGPLREEAAWLVREVSMSGIPILSIDVPSGVDTDTGVEARGYEATADFDEGFPDRSLIQLPGHVKATATVTFGGLRRAHLLSAACGEVVLAEIGLPASARGTSSPDFADGLLSTEMFKVLFDDEIDSDGRSSDAWRVTGLRVVPADNQYDWSGPRTRDGLELLRVPQSLEANAVASSVDWLEPSPLDDKYSGGVVGICAGSEKYLGAGILCTTGAVRGTSAMVRYIGTSGHDVVQALPEVVAHLTVEDAGRVQGWVVGPGRGTDVAAARELSALLDRPEPLLIDADALTILSQSEEHRQKLIDRGHQGRISVLTPHAGEFRRLAAGMGLNEIPDPAEDPITGATAMAVALQSIVLLKGRATVIANPLPLLEGAGVQRFVTVINAGTSWAATPGSGDVLAGLMGAWLAREGAAAVTTAAVIHARAAEVAARTPDGFAPCSASQIAAAIGRATAICRKYSGTI